MMVYISNIAVEHSKMGNLNNPKGVTHIYMYITIYIYDYIYIYTSNLLYKATVHAAVLPRDDLMLVQEGINRTNMCEQFAIYGFLFEIRDPQVTIGFSTKMVVSDLNDLGVPA